MFLNHTVFFLCQTLGAGSSPEHKQLLLALEARQNPQNDNHMKTVNTELKVQCFPRLFSNPRLLSFISYAAQRVALIFQVAVAKNITGCVPRNGCFLSAIQ